MIPPAPSRDGLGDDQVWQWTGDTWEVYTIVDWVDANAGGSPAPVDEPTLMEIP